MGIKSGRNDPGTFQNTDKANPSWIGGLGGVVGTQLDSVGLTWIHLVSLDPTWTHLATIAQTLIHSDSSGSMLPHSVSLGISSFHWKHLFSLGFTW